VKLSILLHIAHKDLVRGRKGPERKGLEQVVHEVVVLAVRAQEQVLQAGSEAVAANRKDIAERLMRSRHYRSVHLVHVGVVLEQLDKRAHPARRAE
jgi:hypothetical protein